MINDTPEPEVDGSLTEHQAAEQLLSKWNKPDHEEESTEETAESTEEEQPKGDAETEEETEETTDAGEVEIDVAGEKFKFPKALSETVTRIQAKAKEVEAGATRKFQEAADLRKAVEVQAQSVQQLHKIAEATADLRADHAWVTRRLDALAKVDIQNTEPETLTRLNAEYNQLMAAKGRIEEQYNASIQKMNEEHEKTVRSKREHAEKVLASKIKGWGPETQKKLAEYVMSKGAPQESLSMITDPWMVEVLEDAAYGHAMRQAKPATKKVVEQAKTLSPGGSGPKTAGRAKEGDAISRLKKSGSVADAAMALLARSANLKR